MSHPPVIGQMMGVDGVKTYTPKTLIVDVKNNYGSGIGVGIRSLDLYRNLGLINIAAPDVSVVGTSFLAAGLEPHLTFYTALSKIGNQATRGWAGNPSNQRLSAVFTAPPTFDAMRMSNAHNSGAATIFGAMDVKMYITPNSFPSIIYNEAIPGGVLIFDSVFDEHNNLNVPDEQDLILI